MLVSMESMYLTPRTDKGILSGLQDSGSSSYMVWLKLVSLK